MEWLIYRSYSTLSATLRRLAVAQVMRDKDLKRVAADRACSGRCRKGCTNTSTSRRDFLW